MIGQGIIQAVKAADAVEVVVCEPSRMRRDIAVELGADFALDPGQRDPVAAVKEKTSRTMATVVFECSGVPIAFKQALGMLRPMGKLMQVAVFEQDLVLDADLMNALTYGNLNLQGCAGAKWPMALELVLQGRFKAKALITHEFSLEDAQAAMETQLNTSEAIKVVVRP